jgi:hypothetical protein
MPYDLQEDVRFSPAYAAYLERPPDTRALRAAFTNEVVALTNDLQKAADRARSQVADSAFAELTISTLDTIKILIVLSLAMISFDVFLCTWAAPIFWHIGPERPCNRTRSA